MTLGPYDGAGPEWDAFVRDRPFWTPFHLYGWKAILEDGFGHECPYLACRDESGSLVGVLPLVRVRSALFGHYLVSMPFLNYGGPLGEEKAVRRLAGAAVRLSEESGADLLELRSRRPLPIDLPVSHRKVTVTMPLPAEAPEVLWDGLAAKVRSQVRRPRKEGVEVRFGEDQIGPFYRVFARHMRDLGTPVLPRELFASIARAFPTEFRVGCAWLGGRPVAGGCGFRWAHEFELTWASSLRPYNRIAPNMLLYWRFMEEMTREGATLFNFGRCTPGGGTHRFKRQWGGEDETLWWYQRSNAGQAGTPSPESPRYALATRLWRRLPLPLANRLGPRLVRFIP
ncbi:MAG: FemAB family XrtA/PEP-CTERM system-associated protein [Gemmatimonadota bacterium]